MARTITVFGPSAISLPKLRLVDDADVIEEIIDLTEEVNAAGKYVGSIATAAPGSYVAVLLSDNVPLGVFEEVVLVGDPEDVIVRQTVNGVGGGGGGTGPGALAQIVECRVGGTPQQNVSVWVTTDAGGQNVIAGTLLTDNFGQVTFMLNEGDYYVWTFYAGHNFPNPTALTVTDPTVPIIIDGTVAAAAPPLSAVSVVVRDQFGSPLKNAEVTAEVVEGVTVATQSVLMTRPAPRYTDAAGTAVLNLVRSSAFEDGYDSTYTINIRLQSGDEKSFPYTVPDQDSAIAPVTV